MQWSKPRQLRILDFDIENRPLSYRGGGYTSAEVTVVAASWVGSDEVDVRALTTKKGSMEKMLAWFVKLYDEADIVTGHFIRRHDLPIMNAALMEYGLPRLGYKLTSDTYLDLPKRKDLSAAQEALAGMLGVLEAKQHMTQTEWRSANRLTQEGVQLAMSRAVDDVKQHKAMREELLRLGYLNAPKSWRG